MASRPRHRRRASLFALLLLVPLIHGAGAHLADFASAVHAAEDLAKDAACHSADVAAAMSAPATHPAAHHGGHSEAGFCALCVATRSAWTRPATEPIAEAVTDGPRLHWRDDDALRIDRPHARPDAPRAPPQPLA